MADATPQRWKFAKSAAVNGETCTPMEAGALMAVSHAPLSIRGATSPRLRAGRAIVLRFGPAAAWQAFKPTEKVVRRIGDPSAWPADGATQLDEFRPAIRHPPTSQ
jgi:hypothetical protein